MSGWSMLHQGGNCSSGLAEPHGDAGRQRFGSLRQAYAVDGRPVGRDNTGGGSGPRRRPACGVERYARFWEPPGNNPELAQGTF